MKKFAVVCLCALLFASVSWAAEGDYEPLECDVGAQCSALAALNIFVSGVGSCSGTSRAECATFAAATEPCIDEVVKVVERDECTEEDIQIAAQCLAKAVAAVYVSAYVRIECTGNGAGCGFAHANGEAWACTFAAAIVDLQVSVGADQAVCDTQVAALAGAFAAVAAEVQELACAEGNELAEAFDDAFVLRVQAILATAIASCWVECDNGSATAEATGTGTVEEDSIDIVEGDGGQSEGGTFGICDLRDPECRESLTGGGGGGDK